jgi:hypothetical protein
MLLKCSLQAEGDVRTIWQQIWEEPMHATRRTPAAAPGSLRARVEDVAGVATLFALLFLALAVTGGA